MKKYELRLRMSTAYEQELMRDWIARMKNAIRTLGWRFSADRMVKDYVKYCYLPAAGGQSSQMSG